MTVSSVEPGTIALSNDYVTLELSRSAPYGLRSLKDEPSGTEFLSGGLNPLYRMTLSRPGFDLLAISSGDAGDVTVVEHSDGRSLTLKFNGHSGLDLDVVCQVSLDPGSGLTRWRMQIQNRTAFAVQGIEYPITVVQCARSAATGATEHFLWGFMGGQIVQDPARNLRPYGGLNFCRLQYPGVVSVQFQAFYGSETGVYLATEDASGSIKRFGATVVEGDGLDLSIEHNHDERTGLSFELPYDTVLGVFHGGWYEAADLYKAWALQQHWCSRRIAERTDIPDWIKEPRPWLCIISRGDYERLRGTVWSPPAEWPIAKFWPAAKVVPLMRDYSAIFEAPVVTWMEGWEFIGAPGGPVDIFPPLEGAESFSSAMAALAGDGNMPSGYLAGFHWCYKRPQVGYDNLDRFEQEGVGLATINEHGGIDHHRFVNDQKHFVNLCIGERSTRELYLDNLSGLMDLGLTALQIDQQIGLYTQACYSEKHGHQAGYGSWMYTEMRDFIRDARRRAKARNEDATFSYEVPCEIWIQEVDLHMHRPYQVRPFGSSAVPLFDYLYHAYALTYGGDTYMGLAHPEVDLIKHATVAAYGVQNLIGIGQPEWDYDVNPDYPALKLMRNIVRAQRTFARDYLVLGSMLKPTPAACATFHVDLYKHAQWMDADLDVGQLEIPSCIHSAWQGESGAIGHVLVNWTADSQDVELELIDGTSLARIHNGDVSRAGESVAGRVVVTVGARDVVLVVEEAR
jgi:hypothetical protein